MRASGFPPGARLLTARQYERILKGRQRSLRQGPFALLAVANDVGDARLGLIVAKRHVAHAVDRNAIKRVVRESFRVRRTLMPAVDAIVMVRFAPGSDRSEWRRDVDTLWQRLDGVLL